MQDGIRFFTNTGEIVEDIEVKEILDGFIWRKPLTE
jgi:hypothetical protein